MWADGSIQVGFIDRTLNSLYQITVYPTWATMKLKLVVYTDPIKT